MKVQFYAALDEIPRTTSQEKGVRVVRGKPMYYTKAKVQDVKNLYTMLLRAHKPPRMLGGEDGKGAIALKVCFYYQAKKPHKVGEPKATRPDTDNMVKLLKDCATACGYWKDDGQVAKELVIKAYGEPCGIYFEAFEIDKQGNRIIEEVSE